MLTVSDEIIKMLSRKKVLYNLKLDTEPSQSRFKVVFRMIKVFGAFFGYAISYLAKFIDYIEILRAPPKEALDQQQAAYS